MSLLLEEPEVEVSTSSVSQAVLDEPRGYTPDVRVPTEVQPVAKSRFRLAMEVLLLVLMGVATYVLMTRSTFPDDPFNTARVVRVVSPEVTPTP